MNKLENFGPVYVINLPSNTKRLKNIKTQFNQFKIKNYKVIEAVDGRKSDLSHIISGEYPQLRPQEIGCIASHIKAIDHWLSTSDTEYAIIMEDDCSFDTVKYWQWDWDYFIKNVPKDADIVQLVMIKNSDVKFSMHKKESFRRDLSSSYAWSTACYLIKRSYAKKVLSVLKKDNKITFSNIKSRNKAADVVLYNLGNAYSMPIFTHDLDIKNSINIGHADFHTRSKRNIDEWWKNNSKNYTKESFFDINNGLKRHPIKNSNISYNIFHVDGETDSLKKRKILTDKANSQLSQSFSRLDTPTIIMGSFEDVKSFYKKSSLNIDPSGHNGNGWKFGELGIWASNYSAWKNFEKSNYQMLMLMEDDILLSKNFNQKIVDYIQELPSDWDFFTVYIPDSGNIRYRSNKKELDIGKPNICKVYQSWSCLCYIISKNGAKKLLKETRKPVSSPLDHWLFYNKNLNGYAIKMEVGNICGIYKTTSTVQSSNKYDMTGYV